MKLQTCRRHFSGLLMAVWLFAGSIAASAAAVPVLPNLAPQQSIGTVNCAGSTCHGSVTPWQNATVLQNEYTTWLRLDQHARAYAVLLNQHSVAIAKKLGMKEAPHEAKLCLDCHAHNPVAAQRGERHTVTDGVGCEACHGPAEKWIGSHIEPGASHAKNVANGLYPTDRPREQAALCLSCHFGDETRFVTHRLMGAGHPRLSFELETFAAIAPAHYRIDDNWRKRKGEYDSIKIWAIGQALASKELLDALTDPKRGRDGLFPELVLFDCQSCHHRMSEQKWSPRLGIGPGRMRLNDSNLLMLRAIVLATYPADANSFDAQVALLHHAVSGDAAAQGADPLAQAKDLSARIGTIIAKFEAQDFKLPQLQKILEALIAEAERGSYSDYAGAEQAYMAISNVANSLNRLGGIKSAPEFNRRLASMRALLSNEELYRRDAFGRELAALRGLVAVNKR